MTAFRALGKTLPPFLIGPMARHAAASLALKIFATGSGFLFAVMAARLLGARGYGVMSVSLSVTAIGTTVSLLGTDGLAVREIAAARARLAWQSLRAFLRWSMLTILVSSSLVGVAVAIVAIFAGPYREALFVAALTVPVMAALQLSRGITQGFGQIIGAQAPLDLIRWILILLLLAVLFLGDVDVFPITVLLVNLAAIALALCAAVQILRRTLQTTSERGCTEPATERWIMQAAPFLGVALFGIAGTEITTLLLGSLAGPSAAGFYQPLAKLSPIMLLGRDAIEMPVAPRVVEMWEAGRRPELGRLLRHSARASVVVTSALCALTLAISKPIFAAFGSGFDDYRRYLYWIVVAQILNAAFGGSPLLMAMAGMMKQRIQTQVVTFVIQAGLGILLIPGMGVAGAVLALTGAILTWSFAHWLLAWKNTGVDTSAFALARLCHWSGR